MIENIRRYTGLIFVVIVLLLLGFIFMDTQGMNRSAGGASVITVDGRGYTQKEFNKIGQAPFELMSVLYEPSFFPSSTP